MEDMTPDACDDLLKASGFGDLALCHDSKAYVIPLYFGYDGKDVYFQCHPGLKDEYIDGTEEACLVVKHVESADIWESVHVFGSIERVTLSDDLAADDDALFKAPFPPTKGHYPQGRPIRTQQTMYYLKLTPSHVHGRQSAYQEA